MKNSNWIYLLLTTAVILMSFATASTTANEKTLLERLPKGTIIAWSPEFAGTSECPSGWKIADGTDETPDLRDRFLLGANTGDADTFSAFNLGHSRGHDGAIYAYYKVPSYSVVYIIKQ